MSLELRKEEVRRRAQTDLYFLATQVLGYDLTEEVHRPVCEFFLKLNPDVPLYALDECKNRLLLDPRGHFKTTIDICHSIQLLLCYPDIRILLVSGTQELAQRMLDEIRRHFLYNEKLRLLFPEYKMTEEDMGTAYEFTVPCRKNWKLREPSVTLSTIASVKAGSHFEYIKYDDVVNEVNSETKEQLAKTTFRFDATIPLLDVPGLGYRDVIGTRYDHSDLYGTITDRAADGGWKIFKRAACTLPFGPTSEILFKIDGKGQRRFDYKTLHRLWKENPRHFGCQYLNDPSFGESSSFPEKTIRNAIVPISAVPFMRKDPMSGQFFRAGKCFITIDLAFSQKKTADYTVMIVGFWDEKGRLFIVDMVRGRFDADMLIYNIIRLVNKWKWWMGRIGIEKNSGAMLIEPVLKAHAAEMRFPLSIDWRDPVPMKSKHENIFGLLPLLTTKSLFFANTLPDLEDLVKEFVRYPRTTHDDIPDAIAMQLKYQTMVSAEVLARVENAAPVPLFMKEAEQDFGPLGYGVAG